MDDKGELLWGMCLEHYEQGRHHEEQRVNTTNLIIAIAGILLATISTDGVSKDEWPLALFIAVLGLFGALFSYKQWTKSKFHIDTGREYRVALETHTGIDLRTLRGVSQAEHEKEFPMASKVRLFVLWISLHLIIAGLGIYLLQSALGKP